MQLLCLILFAAILAVGFASNTTTVLQTLFLFADKNTDGVWEYSEMNGILPGKILKSLFEVIDTDKDEKIRIDEVKKICEEVLDAIFKLNDDDSDDFVTAPELLSGNVGTEAYLEMVAIFFKILDINKDGFLSSQDITHDVQQIDAKSPSLNAIVQGFDVNKDGLIGVQEYNEKHETLGLPKAPKVLVKVLNHIDKDMDNQLTLQEIQDFVRASFDIMDSDKDGIITAEEQFDAFEQVGLNKKSVDKMRSRWQLSRSLSFDLTNRIIAEIDSDEDSQISKDELFALLLSPFNMEKIQAIMALAKEASEASSKHKVEFEPEQQMSTKDLMDSLDKFLDNPRFTRSASDQLASASDQLTCSISTVMPGLCLYWIRQLLSFPGR